MIRKAIALFLVAGSLTFAVLILFQSKVKFLPPEQKISSKSEALPKTETGSANSTEEIAKNIAAELLKLNPDGPSLANGRSSITATDPEKLVKEILPDQMNKIDFSFLNPDVKIDDLKIIKDSDKKVAENYFKNLMVILKSNLDGTNALLIEPSKDNFASIFKAYVATIPQIYNLIVPEGLASLHREEIRLLTIRRNIFESLAGYENDPVKALVSARFLSEVDQQFRQLVDNQLNFIKKNHLSI